MLPDNAIAYHAQHYRMIEPFDPAHLQPASYDLHLDRYFRRFSKTGGDTRLIDPKDPVDLTYPMEREKIGLEPGGFLLAATIEKVRIPSRLVARVEGKSSLARLGLMVHVTAGFIDPGFEGHITLELHCANERGIWLYADMPIAQIAFENLTGTPTQTYEGKYQDAPPGPQASRYWKNFL